MSVFSAAFHAALAHVLQFEGGYADHPEDPGGPTYKGITLALLKRYRNNMPVTKADLKALTPEEVYRIYHRMFWEVVRGDALPEGVSLLVFDAAVNSGPKNATLALQRAIKRYTPLGIRIDGVLGPKTASAVKKLDPELLIDEFAARRMHFYGLLKTFVHFGLGWARRHSKAVRLAAIAVYAAKALLPPKQTERTNLWTEQN